jgi:hypothetical protein
MVKAPPTFQKPGVLASATWQKEIQRVIAVSAYDQITGKATMKDTHLQEQVFKLYHGDPDNPDVVSFSLQWCR